MLAVLIVIVVLGVGLPLVLLVISRRRMSALTRANGNDEIDQWLIGNFELGYRERSRVRKVVLGRPNVESVPLEPALLEAARALAVRVLADRVRNLRRSRRLGWAQLGMTVAYGGCGIAVLVVGSAGQQGLGVIFVLNAVISGVTAVYGAVLVPAATASTPSGYCRRSQPDQVVRYAPIRSWRRQHAPRRGRLQSTPFSRA
jgi:hypothetical protein